MTEASDKHHQQQPGDNRLLWLDMEMTGLDPVTCVPIEVAAIVTDPDLVELDGMQTVIHQPDSTLAHMNDFVRSMHTDNGLLVKVTASTTSLAQADAMLHDFVKRWNRPGKAVLAGNSIHQDRLFLNAYFPKTAPLLHYRMVDVSSIKELVGRWYADEASYEKRPSDHTALSDVRASIEELRVYRSRFFRNS